ncbi:MAG: sulfite exporter TauE/SafE family protein [Patescibacteria group bacterium]
MNLLSIFITGLFTGGLTCLAVQGGLLASSIAQQESDTLKDEALKGHALPILSFLTTRLIAYTVLGILLGSLGSIVQLSLTTRVALQSVAALFMIGTALNLLNVHPIFRYFIIQPPKFLTRMVKSQSRNNSALPAGRQVFGPAIVGAMTVLIPCGATQAMMAYAITQGSPLLGGLVMFTFILGTSPLFFLLGMAAKKLSGTVSIAFHRAAAIAILLIALYNLNGAITLSGSTLTVGKLLKTINCTISFCAGGDIAGATSQTVDTATIYFTPRGYTASPKRITVKSGSTVTLDLINKNGSGCIQSFTIPKLGIQQIVRVGESSRVTFVAPSTTGELSFMCSMGMYQGIINVI